MLPLALVLAASGCATTHYAAKLPDVSTNCVGSLSDVAAIPLKYATPEEDDAEPVEFASIAKCYRPTGSDPTPVALYRFDGIAPPAELNVSVMLSTGGTLAAALDVLDAELQPMQHYGFERFVRRGSQYSLNVFLNPSDKLPAYLLLAPDKAQVGKSDTTVGSTSNPVVIPAGPVMFMYHSGSETNAVRPFLEGGQILITAKPQTTASFSGE